ncbi:MAG TPA: hypothetical protein VF320_05065, partial [Acidimicrobiales bacterium]
MAGKPLGTTAADVVAPAAEPPLPVKDDPVVDAPATVAAGETGVVVVVGVVEEAAQDDGMVMV